MSGRLGSAGRRPVVRGSLPRTAFHGPRIWIGPAILSQSRRSVAEVADSDSGGHRPRLRLRRENSRERHFAVDGLLGDVFYSRSDF